jgi:hypothetical protein
VVGNAAMAVAALLVAGRPLAYSHKAVWAGQIPPEGGRFQSGTLQVLDRGYADLRKMQFGRSLGRQRSHAPGCGVKRAPGPHARWCKQMFAYGQKGVMTAVRSGGSGPGQRGRVERAFSLC